MTRFPGGRPTGLNIYFARNILQQASLNSNFYVTTKYVNGAQVVRVFMQPGSKHTFKLLESKIQNHL